MITTDLQCHGAGHCFVVLSLSAPKLMLEDYGSVVDVDGHFCLTQERITKDIAVPYLKGTINTEMFRLTLKPKRPHTHGHLMHGRVLCITLT